MRTFNFNSRGLTESIAFTVLVQPFLKTVLHFQRLKIDKMFKGNASPVPSLLAEKN